jgi:hypothetical protein
MSQNLGGKFVFIVLGLPHRRAAGRGLDVRQVPALSIGFG